MLQVFRRHKKSALGEGSARVSLTTDPAVFAAVNEVLADRDRVIREFQTAHRIVAHSAH
jgi:hypothetical protein